MADKERRCIVAIGQKCKQLRAKKVDSAKTIYHDFICITST